MAGDWIKMRTDLYRDPKVCIIADQLGDPDGDLAAYVNQHCRCNMSVTRNVLRNVTVGALVTVWGVARHRGKREGDDLVIRGATISVLDDIADIPGFGKAMELVGWVEDTDEGIVFPRFFEEYNVEVGDDGRARNAERQRRYREKRNALRNVTVASQSNGREEESREEKRKKKETPLPPLPEILDTPEFRATLTDWLAQHKPYKPVGLTAMVTLAEGRARVHGVEAVRAAMIKAMANGWQGWDHDSSFQEPAGGNGKSREELRSEQAARDHAEVMRLMKFGGAK